MRYLFIILTIFTAFTVNAQVFVGGSGAMEPTGDFPVAFSNNVKGAPKRVNSLAQRNAIPAALRDTGMTCYVTSIDSTYILRGGIDNTNWQTYSTGGGGTTIISNGGGNIVTRTVTATGLRKDIAVYTGTGVVGSVQPITINGGGMIYLIGRAHV